MTAQHTTHRRQRRPGGFTLIELLVVVGIIAVLAGILVPAFHRAKKLSYSTATQARLEAIGNACEAFKQDHNAYPGLNRWDYGGGANRPVLGLFDDDGEMTGSQVLSMCLLDMYLERVGDWQEGIHHRKSADNETTAPRTYLDVKEAQVDKSGGLTGMQYTLLDAFPPGKQSPILYFVARPGQVQLDEIYKWEDNDEYASNREYDFVLENDGLDPRDEFYKAISRDVASGSASAWDPAHTPYRQDSFILLAPGIDGFWMTADDNKNFNR